MRRWKLIVGAVVLVVVIAGAAAVAVLGSGLGETAAGDVRPGPASQGAAQVVMTDNAFQPTTVDVPAGTPVQIELRNNGQANHNFTNDALHASTGPLRAGEIATMTVTLPKGTTRFVCTWHTGMVIDVNGV
jgi:plastocyanin